MKTTSSDDDDEVVRDAVMRLSRPHPSGGRVIERAAVLAAGADASRILAWVAEHGEAETLGTKAGGQGLHGVGASARGGPDVRNPLRYVLPADALGTD